tara:strand:+ start:493 stop:846 length:354 start_codon:yes stop_codon:yes gene_type:complete
MSLLDKWPLALPHIREALAHSGDMHTPADVYQRIEEGRAELHVGNRSAVVTQALSGGKHLHYWLAGGHLDELKKIERDVSADAKARGFEKVTIAGRRGWLRSLENFEEAATIMVRKL